MLSLDPALVDAVLRDFQTAPIPARLRAPLRRAVEGHVASLWGATRERAEIPEALRAYLDKLGRHAFKIIDEDVERLRAAGHGDEGIFEITLAGAFGAASVGLEQVFEALHGAPLRAVAAPTPS